jgi:hypothetical protein
MENEKIISSKWVDDFTERLRHFRDDDAKIFADDGDVQCSKRPLNVEVGDFHVCGLVMRRYKYKGIDYIPENPCKPSRMLPQLDQLRHRQTI